MLLRVAWFGERASSAALHLDLPVLLLAAQSNRPGLAGQASSLLRLWAQPGLHRALVMERSFGCSWEASREPRHRSAEAGSLSAEGVVLVCTQLLFLNNDLVAKTIGTIWQPRFFEEVKVEYHAKIRRMLHYIEEESLLVTYRGYPFDREDIEAIPLYP
jgi:hypothetical protein